MESNMRLDETRETDAGRRKVFLDGVFYMEKIGEE